MQIKSDGKSSPRDLLLAFHGYAKGAGCTKGEGSVHGLYVSTVIPGICLLSCMLLPKPCPSEPCQIGILLMCFGCSALRCAARAPPWSRYFAERFGAQFLGRCYVRRTNDRTMFSLICEDHYAHVVPAQDLLGLLSDRGGKGCRALLTIRI